MKRTLLSRGWMTALLVAAVVLLAAPVARAAAPLATVSVGPLGLDWQPAGDYEKIRLAVSGPGGLILQREFKGGVAPSLEPFGDDGKPLPDGAYTYELAATPRIDPEIRQALAAARQAGDDDAIAKLQISGKLPRGPFSQSGSFSIQNGTIVSPELQEPTRPTKAPGTKALTPITPKDVVNAADFIIQGSLCVGLDCVNNESFGFDTIRLKENNDRIKFEDTSTGTGFPTHDWQLTANDSASGGAEKFSIEDITASTVPFTVTGSAPTNSIFVDSTGRLGLRTATPVLDVHISTSNTPAIRMEQNSSGGFTAQTWDIAGNEANFFVRDVTGGSRLPFRIRPGAPTSSIDINASGNVGIGTASPSTKLHVLSSGVGSTDGKVLFQNSSGTTTAREGLEINNNGQALFILKDTSQTPRWAIGTLGTSWVVDNQANAGTELSLSSTGNLTITGIYSPSDRNLKKDIEPVRGNEVLTKLASVPISTWTFKTDDVIHIGPMAQDFSAAFGLGIDDKHISPMDLAGVSLAAVQGLNQVVQQKDKEIADLKGRVETLEKLVQGLAQKAGAEAPK